MTKDIVIVTASNLKYYRYIFCLDANLEKMIYVKTSHTQCPVKVIFSNNENNEFCYANLRENLEVITVKEVNFYLPRVDRCYVFPIAPPGEKDQEKYIKAKYFGNLLFQSGLLFDKKKCFATYNALFELSLLHKMIFNKKMEKSKMDFVANIQKIFPNFIDFKIVEKQCVNDKGKNSNIREFVNYTNKNLNEICNDNISILLERYKCYLEKKYLGNNLQLMEYGNVMFGLSCR